jgi:predicted small lipoprotein YifL
MKKIIACLLLLAFASPLAACDRDGPLEKAGEEIDDALDLE